MSCELIIEKLLSGYQQVFLIFADQACYVFGCMGTVLTVLCNPEYKEQFSLRLHGLHISLMREYYTGA